MGVLVGIGTAVVTLCFRFLIEWPPTLWMPNQNPHDFESLPRWLYFALPVGSAIILGTLLKRVSKDSLRTGVPHVITYLHAHDGRLPIKNALIQFWGGAFALATGQSGGREGPAVHLGAAISSYLGQKLQLPNNSLRVLIGCGTAAAIAAAFNTPIAGVIFAMEVIMMEYTIAGFTPVILSTITATTITRAAHGSATIFSIPTVEMNSLLELPYIVLLGLLAGACAALFSIVMKMGLRLSDLSVFQRISLAGLITGCCALIVPEVMGIGYDSLNDVLAGELTITIMLAITVAKLLATAFSCGLGMPVGLIGPSMLIGACLGGTMGALGAMMMPELATSNDFYVMLGMGAMMGAVLNAPLAALMALLEMTESPTIIFPAMLAITIATLTNSEVFKQRSAHQTVIKHLKQFLPTDPISLALQRTSVATLMQRNIYKTSNIISSEQAQKLLDQPYQAYVIIDEQQNLYRVQRKNIATQLETLLAENHHQEISLLEHCSEHESMAELSIQATLREALATMNQFQVNAVYISGYRSGPYPVYGIVTRQDITNYNTQPQQ
jgi:H+/Cl- antiporter ClcA